MNQRAARMVLLLSLSVIISVNTAMALDEGTHAIINEQAAARSQLDQVLKQGLGFMGGIREVFRGKEARKWLFEGGIQEDKPLCRPTRHFHDPLKSWDQAGLSVPFDPGDLKSVILNETISLACGASKFPSSLVWSQTDPQDSGNTFGGNWSWQEARRHYTKALTAASPADREQGWADALRGVGQAMHLVVDASVPEHVRNDVH